MEFFWSKKVDSILKNGRPLINLNVRNWALPKHDALQALEILWKEEIPVLGGDVFENINGMLQANYDNWFCNPISHESEEIYLARTINTARQYIQEYDSGDVEKFFFALIPDI